MMPLDVGADGTEARRCAGGHPSFSVVIPTRNRPADVQRILESLTRVEYPSWDVTVVDQSDDTRTQTVVDTFMSVLPNLRCRHVQVKGTSRARNAGIQATNGEIIAFLDDDCTVRPDWLKQAAAVCTRYPRAAHVFGELRPPHGMAEWSAEGWTPTRIFPAEVEAGMIGGAHNRQGLYRLLGNGASMFVRRDSVPRVGLFDVHLGPGARFPAAEDGDYTYRALMAGCTIVGTPTIVVEHHGLRDYKSGAAASLGRSYNYGTGAWLLKLLRLGEPFALLWILKDAWRCLALIRLDNIVARRGPTGLSSSVMFTRGLIDSFKLRVDRRHGLYRARTAPW